jgi:hypothetical protein
MSVIQTAANNYDIALANESIYVGNPAVTGGVSTPTKWRIFFNQ